MLELQFDKNIIKKCEEAIIISGSARSGTTIIGKLLHSFKGVEYAFEPPMLFSLFALLPVLPKEEWKLLYETYLYEEFLMNALAGRGLNCNLSDDSSIYRVKDKHLIAERLEQSLRKDEAEKKAETSKLVYKIPGITPFLTRLKKYYPGSTVVIMTRKAFEVFNSIMEKGWFRSETLKRKNRTWPNHFIRELRIPFWVDGPDKVAWYRMNEIERIAYYYLRINRSVSELSDCIIIRYEDFIKSPGRILQKLADRLGLTPGEKTEEILNTVHLIPKKRDLKILDRLRPELRQEVEYWSEYYSTNI